MWIRKELKNRAKEVLKNNYWKAFLISIVIALAQGNWGGFGGESDESGSTNQSAPDFDLTDLIPAILIVMFAIIGIVILCIALRVFIGYPLEVGGRKYFIQSAQNSDNKKCFGFAFRRENYAGIILAMLRRDVQNLLWFLLLIVPGIVKYYSYSMVPYILADNPNFGSKRAIEVSEKMTDGHKFNMFVLDLSFIGWFLLGAIALFVGVLFVMPYYNATYAELYLALRQRAVEMNLCTTEEFKNI